MTGDVTIRQIRERGLVCSGSTNEIEILRFLHAGASGYLCKTFAGERLVAGIQAVVAAGKRYIRTGTSPSAIVALGGSESSVPSGVLDPLERRILADLAYSASLDELEQVYLLKPGQAETHFWDIVQKLGMPSLSDLTEYAARQGWRN